MSAQNTTRGAVLGLALALAGLTGCDGEPELAGPAGPDRIAFEAYKGDDLRGAGGLIDTALGKAEAAGSAVELVITDVWGRLPDRPSTLRLRHVDTNTSVTLEGYLQPVVLNLAKSGLYELLADVPDHHPEKLTFVVMPDGSVPVPADQVRHWSLSRDLRELGGTKRTVHALYLGLAHKDFAASGPAPRRATKVELFDNGRAAFASMARDLANVRERAHFAYWLVRGDFELTRPDDWRSVTPAQRAPNTMLGWLDRLPGTRRVLLNQFWGDSPYVNETLVIDDDLVDRARAANDGIEVVLQGNDTEVPYYDHIELRDDEWSFRERLFEVNPALAERDFLHEEVVKPAIYDRDIAWSDVQAASWHQKFAVLDGKVAYLGGMNMNTADWDQPDLQIYNPLRMLPDASKRDRERVEAGIDEPASGPRRDYMVRLEGRIVDDIEAEFQKRWDLAMMRGDPHAERASAFNRTVPPDVRGEVDGLEVQLTVTNPMPFWEHSVLEAMRRMIEQANSYIYIEDQYFRAPLLNELIVKRMHQVPGLKLIVITKPVDYFDPGRKWTALSVQDLLTQFPDRVAMLQLKAHDIRPDGNDMVATFVGVDVHSKMIIVDDRILSVGSTNKNNRGLIYEGEANLVVRNDAWVRAHRIEIFQDLVGDIVSAEDLADIDIAFDVLKGIAKTNAVIEAAWDEEDNEVRSRDYGPELEPEGRVYPLEVPYRWWFDVGPDFS